MHTPDSEQISDGSTDAPVSTIRSLAQADHPQRKAKTGLRIASSALILLLVFVLGLGSGYQFWGRSPAGTVPDQANAGSEPGPSPDQVSLPNDYSIPVFFSDIGPQLVTSGAIDYDRFVQVYDRAGQPLTEEQLDILTQGSDAPIVINRENAYFLLNFFWALGLTNQNALLEEGPMMQYGQEEVGHFASTGGWTLGSKPATTLYASTPIITLTPEQQARLEEVASGVYRPCCDNPTSFPDCNHGMAMLGLLELMASQDTSVDEMFAAAKYANAFWFPQQTLEMASFFKNTQGLDFAEVDAREFVGASASSGSGFRAVHQWLVTNDLLDQVPSSGSSCGV